MHLVKLASAAAAVLALSSAAATTGRVSVLAVRSSKQPISSLGEMMSDNLDNVTVANLGANRLKARGVGENASRAPNWHQPPPQQEANWSVLFPSQAPGATGPHSHPLAPAPAQHGPGFATPYVAPYHPAFEDTWNHGPPPVQHPQWDHPSLNTPQPAVYPPPPHGYNPPPSAYYPPQARPDAAGPRPSPVQAPPFFPTYQTGTPASASQPHQPHQPPKPAKPSKPPGSPARPCSPTRPPKSPPRYKPPRRQSPPRYHTRPHHGSYSGSGGYGDRYEGRYGGRYGRDDYFNGYIQGSTDAQIMDMATGGPSRPTTTTTTSSSDDCCKDCCTGDDCKIM